MPQQAALGIGPQSLWGARFGLRGVRARGRAANPSNLIRVMPAEGAEMRASELPHIAADLLTRLRERAPRVHCITNAVAQAFTANVLLAVGAIPSMTLSADEIGAFVARADALLVNLGTFDAERREAAATALEVASEEGVPWVLDPVFIDRSEPRAAYAKSLVAHKPRAIRLNRAEFMVLSGAEPEGEALSRYALDTLAVVALTGTVDQITDGAQRVEIENGHPLMARVTAMGCAASALNGAFLAVESDPFLASAAALLCFGVAGGIAGERATGPGSFATAILDALYALDRNTLIEKARTR
jgi:hydroxyethylthiazole kinase